MVPREGPMQPHPDSFDTSPGALGVRYDLPLLPWKERFDGGPAIFVADENGKRRTPIEADFYAKPLAASDTGESEAESSVISVDDFGFSAAPTESISQSSQCHDDCKDQDDTKTVRPMTIDELRDHLECHGGSEQTIEQLVGNKIERCLETSRQDNETYLPLDSFEAIFGIEIIQSLIKEAFHKSTQLKWEELAAQIIGGGPGQGYRRILGVLVLMNKLEYIVDFIRERVKDYDMPIKKSADGNKIFETRAGKVNSTLFEEWHRNDIELFYVYQREIFVPFFDIQEHKLCSYTFGPNVRLPWKEFEQKTSGGNGLVYKVQIHPRHHNFRSSSDPKEPPFFALKEIHTSDREAYKRELWALEKSAAHAQKEKHLIKLLLTFKHGNVCYFLFEWADGNLADFWEEPEILPAPSDAWAIQQVFGISSAIKRIHGLATWQKQRRSSRGSETDDEREWGRHGDIKPNNILWFKEYSDDSGNILHHHLVVSDLGLTRYHSRNTRSDVHRSKLEGCTWGYQPPEMDIEGLISAKYDIWSLGCVFLEFCVWYVEGGDAVRIFGWKREAEDESEIPSLQSDKYFNSTTDGQGRKTAYLKPIVEKYLSTKLCESSRFTPFVERMLDLIKRCMLVTDQKERWRIDQICAEIVLIKHEILKDPEQPRSTLKPASQEIPAECRPLINPESLNLDNLVNHAQGNSGDILAESPRRRSLSIQTEDRESDGSPNSQNSTNDSPLDIDESRDDSRPPKESSGKMQMTVGMSGSPARVTTDQHAAAQTSSQENELSINREARIGWDIKEAGIQHQGNLQR